MICAYIYICLYMYWLLAIEYKVLDNSNICFVLQSIQITMKDGCSVGAFFSMRGLHLSTPFFVSNSKGSNILEDDMIFFLGGERVEYVSVIIIVCISSCGLCWYRCVFVCLCESSYFVIMYEFAIAFLLHRFTSSSECWLLV